MSRYLALKQERVYVFFPNACLPNYTNPKLQDIFEALMLVCTEKVEKLNGELFKAKTPMDKF